MVSGFTNQSWNRDLDFCVDIHTFTSGSLHSRQHILEVLPFATVF